MLLNCPESGARFCRTKACKWTQCGPFCNRWRFTLAHCDIATGLLASPQGKSAERRFSKPHAVW